MSRIIFLILGIIAGWKLNDRFENSAPTSPLTLAASPTLPSSNSIDSATKDPEYAKFEIESIESTPSDNEELHEDLPSSERLISENQATSLAPRKPSSRASNESLKKFHLKSSDPQQTALAKIRADLNEKPNWKEEKVSKLNIELSKDQLFLLEQNISELRETTSTTYAEGGWTIRFHQDKNFLRLIGIRDQDFVRLDSLKKLKQEPRSRSLASRFENILISLEE